MAEKKPPIDYTKLRALENKDAQKTDELIQRLEDDLERTKLQYQLYYIGTVPKPPYEERGKLDRLAMFCRQHVPPRTESRFRMFNILTKDANYQELWDKTIRRIEEGEKLSWVPISLREAHEEEAEAEKGKAAAAAASSNGQQASLVASIRDPMASAEEEEVRKIYNSYVAARKKVRPSDQEIPFERFQQALAKQIAPVVEKSAKGVLCRVEITEGKVSLKVRPMAE